MSKKSKNCICGKSIWNTSEKCKKCSRLGELNPNFGNHKLAGINNPMYGKIRIDMRGKNNFNYIDGRTLKQYYCIKCLKKGIKTEINYYIALYGQKRCIICDKQLRKEKMSNKNNYSYIDGRTLIKHCCINCKKEIGYYSWYYGKARCHSCATIGKNNPNYVHGRGHYPYTLGFNNILKSIIRKRDNFVCSLCGVSEEIHLIINKQALHIHHIDYDKKNCEEKNLITLCRKCNSKVNKNRLQWYSYFNYLISKKGIIKRNTDKEWGILG